ncbi:MAG: hypothetical protein AAF944_05940 [Bacteroidota bacterium]
MDNLNPQKPGMEALHKWIIFILAITTLPNAIFEAYQKTINSFSIHPITSMISLVVTLELIAIAGLIWLDWNKKGMGISNNESENSSDTARIVRKKVEKSAGHSEHSTRDYKKSNSSMNELQPYSTLRKRARVVLFFSIALIPLLSLAHTHTRNELFSLFDDNYEKRKEREEYSRYFNETKGKDSYILVCDSMTDNLSPRTFRELETRQWYNTGIGLINNISRPDTSLLREFTDKLIIIYDTQDGYITLDMRVFDVDSLRRVTGEKIYFNQSMLSQEDKLDLLAIESKIGPVNIANCAEGLLLYKSGENIGRATRLFENLLHDIQGRSSTSNTEFLCAFVLKDIFASQENYAKAEEYRVKALALINDANLGERESLRAELEGHDFLELLNQFQASSQNTKVDVASKESSREQINTTNKNNQYPASAITENSPTKDSVSTILTSNDSSMSTTSYSYTELSVNQDGATKNEKWNIVAINITSSSRGFEKIVDDEFDYAQVVAKEFVIVTKDGKKGVYKYNSLLIEVNKEDIDPVTLPNGDVFFIVKESKEGVLNSEGKVLVPLENESVKVLYEQYHNFFLIAHKHDGVSLYSLSKKEANAISLNHSYVQIFSYVDNSVWIFIHDKGLNYFHNLSTSDKIYLPDGTIDTSTEDMTFEAILKTMKLNSYKTQYLLEVSGKTGVLNPNDERRIWIIEPTKSLNFTRDGYKYKLEDKWVHTDSLGNILK